MLKKTILKLGWGALLILLIATSTITYAQDGPTATPTPEATSVLLATRSGRYAVEVPLGWYASVEPHFANLQVLPSEVITLADAEETADALADDEEFNLKDDLDNLNGAILLTTIWPANLLEAQQLTAADFEADFAAQFLDEYAGSLRETVQLTGISGTRYTFQAEGGVASVVYFLNDAGGNLLMIFAGADADHQADLTATIESLTYFAFSAEDLVTLDAGTYEVMVVPAVLIIDVPLGWWMIPGEGSLLTVTSSPQTVQFLGPTFASVTGETGLLSIALQLDPSLLIEADEGTATPLSPEEIATQVATILFESEPAAVQSTVAWQNENGLTGWEINLTTDLGNETVFIYVLVVDNGDKLAVLGVIADAENAPDYAPLVEAIFASARRPITP